MVVREEQEFKGGPGRAGALTSSGLAWGSSPFASSLALLWALAVSLFGPSTVAWLLIAQVPFYLLGLTTTN